MQRSPLWRTFRRRRAPTKITSQVGLQCRALKLPDPLEFLSSPTGLALLLVKKRRPQRPPDADAAVVAGAVGAPLDSPAAAAAAGGPPAGGATSAAGVGSAVRREPQQPSSSSSSSFFMNESVGLALVVLIVTAVWKVAESQGERVADWLKEKCYARLELRSCEGAHRAVMFWLGQEALSGRTKNMALLRGAADHLLDDDGRDDGDGAAAPPLVGEPTGVVPGFGTHLLTFEGRRVWVTRSQDTTSRDRSWTRQPDEVLTLATFGPRELLLRLVASARASVHEHRRVSIAVFLPDQAANGWEQLCHKLKRPMHTLYLAPPAKAAAAEAEEFFLRRAEYQSLGVPWRRGYLFVGPPGTGKSSLVSAIASRCNAPIYVLQTRSGEKLTDDAFMRLVNSVPQRSVLLLEDLDTAPLHGLPKGSLGGPPASLATSGGLSLSGLLNALDGVACGDGRLLFVTANDAAKLPPALMRPGRIDKVVRFEHLSLEDMTSMAKTFFPNDPATVESVVAPYQPGTDVADPLPSPAAWQNRLMSMRLAIAR